MTARVVFAIPKSIEIIGVMTCVEQQAVYGAPASVDAEAATDTKDARERA
jgi:hypothetical protein